MTELQYSDKFKCYELLLADIVELIPTKEQSMDLEKLKTKESDFCKFANADEIKSLGIVPGTDKLEECIADHSNKILQENEQYLMKEPSVGTVFNVEL